MENLWKKEKHCSVYSLSKIIGCLIFFGNIPKIKSDICQCDYLYFTHENSKNRIVCSSLHCDTELNRVALEIIKWPENQNSGCFI